MTCLNKTIKNSIETSEKTRKAIFCLKIFSVAHSSNANYVVCDLSIIGLGKKLETKL